MEGSTSTEKNALELCPPEFLSDVSHGAGFAARGSRGIGIPCAPPVVSIPSTNSAFIQLVEEHYLNTFLQ